MHNQNVVFSLRNTLLFAAHAQSQIKIHGKRLYVCKKTGRRLQLDRDHCAGRLGAPRGARQKANVRDC